ncbi:hypothetical protein PQ478_11260 [Alkalihalophilus pseudofirmus]|uniref:hypothetical protein n=1 Tax=Alkalihalophilus pseudofirmus TaxID=79885 RepID=UPI00259BAE9B|nr:hypothetical protein [Alkalihalophilus pseudofirmus]WEG15118.1 hypothetical protein PQ478_11260 [Alkalihalophilus pseudofirmus]
MNNRKLLLIIYMAIIVLAIVLIITNKLNPVGYAYSLSDDLSVITIEEGYLTKEVYQFEVETSEALRIVLPITEANQLWELNVAIFALLVATFNLIYPKVIKPQTYSKWITAGFILLLIVLAAFHFNAHLELHRTISEIIHSSQ